MPIQLLHIESFSFFIGHGIIAANSSIPSKYQTVVVSNADKKGFGGTSTRFQYDAYVVSKVFVRTGKNICFLESKPKVPPVMKVSLKIP